MERASDLLSSFDKSWKNFSGTWKRARVKASEKSIHDLRVNTRRLIATLELARSLSHRSDISKLQRRCKKILKSMGPLRDTQVLLENLGPLRGMTLISDFKKTLKRRERREIDSIRSELKRSRKHELSKRLDDVRSELTRVHESLGASKIHRSIERALNSRRNEFLRAVRTFQRSQPSDENLLHEMRIALKKLRYALEAAQTLLGHSVREQLKRMQEFQQLMGDSRDLEMLRAELEKWADKRGKRIAMVPALDRLQQERESLLKRIIESAGSLEALSKTEAPQPVSEQTHAVVLPKPFVRSAAASS
jgi:CHAD domain-containing protein